MTKRELHKVVWIINTIYDAGKISFDEMNLKWKLDDVDDGNPMIKRTFHTWQNVAWEVFHIYIKAERRRPYRYYIVNPSEFNRTVMDEWLLKP